MIKLKDILIESSEEKALSQLDNLMGDFTKAVKNTNVESEETNEGVAFTIAGIILSFGEIMDLFGKLVNLISKIPGLNFLSGDKIIELGEKYHHAVIAAFESLLLKAGVPKKNAHNFALKMHVLIVAILLYKGVGSAAVKFGKGLFAGAIFKSALVAVKASEIDDYIKHSAENS